MKFFTQIVFLILIATLLSACRPTDDPLLDARRESAATQVAALITTVTLDAARLQTTLDYSVTRASLAATQGGLLELTLVARGTSVSVLRDFRSQMLANFATPTPLATSAVGLPDRTDSAAPTPLVITPLALPAISESTANLNAPRLENIVTATDVDGDDCALGTTNQFTTASPAIYVVARAINISPDTRLSSRWNFDGQQIIRYEFTPNFIIENACIWFFMDQADVTFSTGEWSVQLDINDTPYGLPVTFTMRDAMDG